MNVRQPIPDSKPIAHISSSSSSMNAGNGDESATAAPYPTFTLSVAGLLAVGLFAKAFSASRQARISRHEADSWRQVALRLVDRGEGKLTYEEVDQVRRAKWVERGCPPPPSPIRVPERVRSHVPSKQDEAQTGDHRNLKQTYTSEARSGYDPIHPHEDWDWTPADWPVKRSSWHRSRLPPWSIGFSRTAKAPSKPSEHLVEPVAQHITPTVRPKHGLEAAIAAHQTGASAEELLFQSAVWPDAQPAEPNAVAGESAFIAEEVINEILEQQHKVLQKSKAVVSNSSAAASKRPRTVIECQTTKKKEAENGKAWITFDATSQRPEKTIILETNDPSVERVDALERQVWALLRRIEDLERYGQTGRRF